MDHKLPPDAPKITTNVDEVVTPQSLHMHLACLHKFYQMAIQDNEELDKLYLNRAEYRYTLWMQIIHKLKPNPLPLPPWDVALVWHAHMLSPFRYAEDMVRLYKMDAIEINFPLEALHEAIATDLNYMDPEAVRFWEQNTNEPYILDERNIDKIKHQVQCPWCRTTTTLSCADNLSAWRFLEDITNTIIAGTLLDLKTGLPDYDLINEEYAYLFRAYNCPMQDLKRTATNDPSYCEDAQTIELCQVGNQPWRGPAGADFTGRYYHPGLLPRYSSQLDATREHGDGSTHRDSLMCGAAASYYGFMPMYPIFVGTACGAGWGPQVREEHVAVQDVAVQDVVVRDVVVRDVVVQDAAVEGEAAEVVEGGVEAGAEEEEEEIRSVYKREY
ncbi:uncharacterized protein VTP21DRAFT_4620 [Calcarisporiella thermophila]|uniref:uncharacterized protein n=1 Tax=Calcarisporiella thermophila TaxID=911321 RepID=UPI0037423A18